MLDYGCGRGPTAKAAAKKLPGWSIDGYDLDRRAEQDLKQIPGFEQLFTGDVADIPQKYDLIVLMHALEHIPQGADALRQLGQLLRPGGRILVQVPNRIANPFDLVVADHATHFDRASLYRMVQNSGLAPIVISENWVTKELTAVAGHDVPGDPPEAVTTPLAQQVDWLASVAETARSVMARQPLGIFGSSIVGTWIRSEIGRPPDFYIDDDQAKQGRSIEGAPIIALTDAPSDATVILAMAPQVAKIVAPRVQEAGLTVVTLPEYPG